jgi:hypothetical protein
MMLRSPRPSASLVLAAFAGLALVATAPSLADAQPEEEKPIFRRFALTRERPKFWQALFELPVQLRPQGQPDAEIERNLGLNYVTSFRPNNRIYFSRSLGFTRMEWLPKNSSQRRVKVKTFDITLILNNLLKSSLVTSFGIGLGIMDGLITFNDERNFSTRLEPFIPLQVGVGLRLGRTQVGLKVSQFSFIRSNPIISNTRILLGVGFNY